MRIFSEYHDCFVLPVLCAARPTQTDSWETDRLSLDIYDYLDLRTIRSSLGPRRPADSYRFGNFDLPSPVFGDTGFTIDTEDWHYGIDVLAIADFDADGRTEVLAQFVDIAKTASYFDASPVILRRTKAGGLIEGERLVWSVLNGAFTNWPDDPMTCAP